MLEPRSSVPVIPGGAAAEDHGPSSVVVDWMFVAAAMDGLAPSLADHFLECALADARQGLEGLSDPMADAGARCRLANRLAGTTRSFGLVGLGDAAAALERAVETGLDARPALAVYAAALDATATQLAARQRPPLAG